jgi:glycosyltransferase involved in cell wall biosynthesis
VCMGSVSLALDGAELPGNVDLTGQFAPEFKRAVLSVADLALNPVATGSGTNLKMLDYFAAGTPVVSTPFGARGLGVNPGEHYMIGESHRFGQAIEDARQTDEAVLSDLTCSAWTHVCERLTWPTIATAVLASLPGG